MRHLLSLLLFVLVFAACADEYGIKNSNTPDANTPDANSSIDIPASFIKLQDDSSHVAGVVEINAPSSEVKLTWDVLPGCNLDTTQTRFSLQNGRGKLAVKWDKRLENGLFGPKKMTFNAGVLIESEDYKEYVQLIWADEIDSLQMNKNIHAMTRAAGGIEPRAMGFTLDPILLPVNPGAEVDGDTCAIGILHLDGGMVFVNFADFQKLPEYNLFDFTSLQGTYSRKDDYDLVYKWRGADRPTDPEFIGFVKFTLGSTIIRYQYLQYIAPQPDNWDFKKSIPEAVPANKLPATGATVIVTVNTTRPWYIESDQASGSPVNSATNATGEQSLVILISDNDDISERDVIVKVVSQGMLKETLMFKQLGREGTFDFVKSEPAEVDSLDAAGEDIKFTVNTTRETWWIKHDLETENVVDKKQEGAIHISENTSGEAKDIIVTIGYGDVTKQTFVFKQKASKDIVYTDDDLDNPIPVTGKTYTFTFTGKYLGSLQVRAKSNDNVLVTGTPTTDQHPKVTIPDNSSSLSQRDIAFEYRMGTGEWMPLPESTNRPQSKAEITSKVLPSGEIPAEGGPYSCVFGGTYNGPVVLGAIIGNDTIKGNGTCPGAIEVSIPKLTGTSDRQVTFIYSTDGGSSWLKIADKTQTAGTILFGSVTPDGNIPAGGKTYNCTASGTFTGTIIFRASVGGVELVRQSSKLPKNFELAVPANEGDVRNVVFEYSRDGGTEWHEVENRDQERNINVKPGGGIGTDDYEKGDGSNTNVEL